MNTRRSISLMLLLLVVFSLILRTQPAAEKSMGKTIDLTVVREGHDQGPQEFRVSGKMSVTATAGAREFYSLYNSGKLIIQLTDKTQSCCFCRILSKVSGAGRIFIDHRALLI